MRTRQTIGIVALAAATLVAGCGDEAADVELTLELDASEIDEAAHEAAAEVTPENADALLDALEAEIDGR